MKRYIKFITGLMVSVGFAQEMPEIIYCNQYQNVALVMSSPIAQAATGSENFIFSYNSTAVDSLGLLQGRPGVESNLLIRTMDGGLYNYLLKHSDSLSRFVYFIKPDARVKPLPEISVPITKENNINSKTKIIHKQSDYYRKLSEYYLNRSSYSLGARRKNKIKLEVQGMYYYKDEVFMVLNIQNRSRIDFKVNTIDLTKIHGIKGRKSSFQKSPLKVVYKHDFPEMINSGSNHRFIMVYPKFTLGDHEKLLIELTEDDGSRELKLISNP